MPDLKLRRLWWDIHGANHLIRTWPNPAPLHCQPITVQARKHPKLAWECYDKAVAAHGNGRLVTLTRHTWHPPRIELMARHEPEENDHD